MEARLPKSNQVLLIILGIAILIVVVIGASYAYFNATSVTGNLTNKINTATAKYGSLTVTYPGTDGIINMGTIDLPESSKGTIVQGLLKFTVSLSADATISTNYNIKWAGTANVENTFCQYRDASYACLETTSGTYVGDEINYTLYKCTSAGYTGTTISGTTVTVNAGCTAISTANTAAPYSTAQKSAIMNTVSGQTPQTVTTSNRTNYHILVLNIKNTNDVQDYNQGKNFRGALAVEALTN